MAEHMPPQASIRVIREHMGLTLADVAARICEQGVPITGNGLNNAELGRRPVSEPVLNAWARALGIDRHHIHTGPELIRWVTAVQGEAGCTCRAGLPRHRRTPARSVAA